jgi:hypothetical protein
LALNHDPLDVDHIVADGLPIPVSEREPLFLKPESTGKNPSGGEFAEPMSARYLDESGTGPLGWDIEAPVIITVSPILGFVFGCGDFVYVPGPAYFIGGRRML